MTGHDATLAPMTLSLRERLLPKPSITLRARNVPMAIREQLGFTERQLDCLLLARAGMTNKEIAIQLGISSRTVEIFRQQARGLYGNPPIVFLILMIDRILTARGM